MNTNPINPYTLLKNRAHNFEKQVVNPVTKVATWFAKKDLDAGWNLKFIYHRVEAADALGFDSKLIATDRGLEVIYVKRPEREFF